MHTVFWVMSPLQDVLMCKKVLSNSIVAQDFFIFCCRFYWSNCSNRGNYKRNRLHLAGYCVANECAKIPHRVFAYMWQGWKAWETRTSTGDSGFHKRSQTYANNVQKIEHQWSPNHCVDIVCKTLYTTSFSAMINPWNEKLLLLLISAWFFITNSHKCVVVICVLEPASHRISSLYYYYISGTENCWHPHTKWKGYNRSMVNKSCHSPTSLLAL